MQVVLASKSRIRASMLRAAGLDIDTVSARVDEEALRTSLALGGADPREIADALAEAKARKVGARSPGALVLGCDQVLDLDGQVMAKPADPDQASRQLAALSGRSHRLLSACVAYEDGAPVWRHVGVATMRMRQLSEGYVADYIGRNWESVRQSVGAYKIEEEGARLFTAVEGSHFDVQGLPLLPLLSWLILRGILPS